MTIFSDEWGEGGGEGEAVQQQRARQRCRVHYHKWGYQKADDDDCDDVYNDDCDNHHQNDHADPARDAESIISKEIIMMIMIILIIIIIMAMIMIFPPEMQGPLLQVRLSGCCIGDDIK